MMQKDSPLIAIGLHLIFLMGGYFLMYSTELVSGFPSPEDLLHWDADWYYDIATNGYIYKEGEQSNIAFFPLFPILWSILGISATWISSLNYLCMLIGMLILLRMISCSLQESLILLSIPSLFFTWIPYSEGLFFLSCSIFLWGLQKENDLLSIIGLLMAATTRAAAMIFGAALIALIILYFLRERKIKKIYFILILIMILITIIVHLGMEWDAGVSFGLLEAQQYWGRALQLPGLIITTVRKIFLIGLDGPAFLSGVFAAVLLLMSIPHLRKPRLSSATWFSLLYLILVTVVALFFSPKNEAGQTQLQSLHRFIFATPFFSLFLVHIHRQVQISWRSFVFFISIIFIVWFAFGFLSVAPGAELFDHPWLITQLLFILLTLWVLLFWVATKWISATIGLYVINTGLQLYLFSRFIEGAFLG